MLQPLLQLLKRRKDNQLGLRNFRDSEERKKKKVTTATATTYSHISFWAE